MYWTKRHVLICNASHCASKGANDVAGRMRLEVIRRKLDSEILINNCGTIDLCDIGPNIVVYPDNVILSGVKLKDVGRVVDYLAGGDVPRTLSWTPRRSRKMPAARSIDAAVSAEGATMLLCGTCRIAWFRRRVDRRAGPKGIYRSQG